MEKVNKFTSYRSELEGMFRCLKHIEHIGSPDEIKHWCDNEQAVKKNNEGLVTTRETFQAMPI